MMLAVLATLWLAVRSFRIIACILITLFVGLAITMALGPGRRAASSTSSPSRSSRCSSGSASISASSSACATATSGFVVHDLRAIADLRRAQRRHAAGAGGGGDGGGVLLVPADLLCRRRRTRPGRRHRHDRGVRAEHHAAAGAADAAAARRRSRTRSATASSRRSTGSWSRIAAGADRRGAVAGGGRAGADGVREVRFQSARPAQRQDRVGVDHPGPDEGPADLAQHHRRAGAEPEGGAGAGAAASRDPAGRPGDHAERVSCRTISRASWR